MSSEITGCTGPIVEQRGLCCDKFTLGEPEKTEHADMLNDLGQDWFTCKNWNKETRLCMIYETRPQMCRDYPEPGKICLNCRAGEKQDAS